MCVFKVLTCDYSCLIFDNNYEESSSSDDKIYLFWFLLHLADLVGDYYMIDDDRLVGDFLGLGILLFIGFLADIGDDSKCLSNGYDEGTITFFGLFCSYPN